ncbi:dihydrolipoyllysine-residue acetyltransferase [Nocardioides jiangxiensis]|uniref:Acetyltransferase component of pyruvate dehydrogenase complex n=1 Tax=Nocardioides jiangxiensis TaxID=3064524 RepID=A0ABT9B0L3_9ACTN|nr:dihydrolipoyllysine-residue acetyltransferase [Nocardioides sp. WY-20]MDO7868359.1 dihydrolipoyllysine-residue acetyltransferase [Nocardioides sp. WY-20]
MEIKVPDIGEYTDVPVIDVLVSVGDTVEVEAPLITLETDKATMDIPAPSAGTITSLTVKVGDTVSQGSVIAVIEGGDAPAEAPAAKEEAPAAPAASPTEAPQAAAPAPSAVEPAETATPAPTAPSTPSAPVSSGDSDGLRATPLVRRLARELEVELSAVKGTGVSGRVTKQDLLAHYAGGAAPAAAASSGGSGIPPIPPVDFAKFGPIRTVPLPRIKKISGPFLHRSWLNVPHVTHNDEADITDLDAYRKELDAVAKTEGYRVTLLAFLLKASASALRKYPELNSSLAGDDLVYKDYINIGVAVDTPEGLVVPVVKDVDRKGITELSHDLADLSSRAREGKLAATDMQGGTFTISSLGGIGGTSFTPIVNAPEVAILGVVRSKMAPVWNGTEFEPRLMLPLSLSYDHRVIDGALAARFTAHLGTLVSDVRRLVL